MRTPEQLQDAILLVAYASLKESAESLSVDNIEAEAARIERCVEFEYKNSKLDLHFDEFVVKFLTDNYLELVYGDLYLNDYLDDVPEPNIEEVYEI